MTGLTFGWPRSGSARFEVGISHRLGGTVLNSEN